jgi:hypothetical protein
VAHLPGLVYARVDGDFTPISQRVQRAAEQVSRMALEQSRIDHDQKDFGAFGHAKLERFATELQGEVARDLRAAGRRGSCVAQREPHHRSARRDIAADEHAGLARNRAHRKPCGMRQEQLAPEPSSTQLLQFKPPARKQLRQPVEVACDARTDQPRRKQFGRAWAWATAIGYDPDAFSGEKPQTLADFFDVQRFPGQRGLQRDPRIVMEWALLADGVPVDEVYEALATPDGVDRALAVMDPIKPYLTWWEEGSDPIDMLRDGEVAMTSIWGGEMTDAILRREEDISPIWDGLVLKLDHLAVVKGSPNRDKAFEFIRFATATEPLAEQVRHIYHSPARRSSMALIDDEITPYLPTTPEHMATAIENNARFWADNHERLQARFDGWLDVPLQKGLAGAPR